MRGLWERIPPLARGLGIVALIALVVVVLSLEPVVATVGGILQIAFFLAIALFLFLVWRERRGDLEAWSDWNRKLFYAAVVLAVVAIGLMIGYGLPGEPRRVRARRRDRRVRVRDRPRLAHRAPLLGRGKSPRQPRALAHGRRRRVHRVDQADRVAVRPRLEATRSESPPGRARRPRPSPSPRASSSASRRSRDAPSSGSRGRSGSSTRKTPRFAAERVPNRRYVALHGKLDAGAARDRAAGRAVERLRHARLARLRRPVGVVDPRLPAGARALVAREEEQHAADRAAGRRRARAPARSTRPASPRSPGASSPARCPCRATPSPTGMSDSTPNSP